MDINHLKEVYPLVLRSIWFSFRLPLLGSNLASALSLAAVTPLSVPEVATAACRDVAEIPRTILALYDGARSSEPRYTPIHRYAEMPLNHLGYRLVYHDISTGTPPPPDAPLAATISWFNGAVGDPVGFATWRAGFKDRCGRAPATIVFGHTGLTSAAAATESGAVYLRSFGAKQADGDLSVGPLTSIALLDPATIGFETAFEIARGPYSRITTTDEAESHLRLLSGDAAIDLVVLAPQAVYAHDSALVRHDPRGGPLWTVNPFVLFAHALNGSPWPIPDTTTLSGRRMFFATLTPEGWLTQLPALQFGDRPPLASQVLESALISQYPSLPFSVALLAGDLDPSIAGPAASRGREAAVRLLQLPHVQPATMGLTMILNWGFFAEYDAEAESAALASGAAHQAGRGVLVTAVQNLGTAFSEPAVSALDITPNAPRKYSSVPFDLASETRGALDRIAALAPPNRAPQLFVWGGNSLPFPGAIAATREAGAWNMGGGGGRASNTMPSLSNLWPLGLETSGGLQVYNALSGDAVYTDFWTGNLIGFQALAQTLESTEFPRRLKPFQVSFAAQSALAFSSLQSVRSNLDLALTAKIAPVHALRYAETVAGFQGFRVIAGDGGRTWRIKDRGGLHTARFDAATGLALDLAESDGVIGASRHNGSLYVGLDPGNDSPQIVLADTDTPAAMVGVGSAPALIQARAEILDFKREGCAVRATLLGFDVADTEWLASPGLSYEVTLYEADGVTRRHWQQVTAGPDGHLAVDLPLPSGLPTQMSITTPCPQG